jgi:hypothetical protein
MTNEFLFLFYTPVQDTGFFNYNRDSTREVGRNVQFAYNKLMSEIHRDMSDRAFRFSGRPLVGVFEVFYGKEDPVGSNLIYLLDLCPPKNS